MQPSLKYVNNINPVIVTATIEWLSAQEGGRQQPPAIGPYYAVARFSIKPAESWSVVFQLEFHLRNSDSRQISRGTVRFLVDHAPHEYLVNYHSFDIYEGPRLVARVFLL
ncbi:hypothetical protein [Providencia rettgeri]|uniref:hypothetical protein n=1 Tax=Providencia rettgeri TaxID=587 RepID=UPI0034E0B26C